jgi:16S rRNA (cytosine1407-C5)-methyltransferase
VRTFRLTARAAQSDGIKQLLRKQGFAFSPLPFYREAFLLEEEPLPLGASLAARFGYIYIQDASSMLPALALLDIARQDAASGASAWREAPLRILDLCSSPGGKSGLLARELLENPHSFVLANEPGGKRLATLQRNLQAMNLFNCATCAFSGESLNLPDAGPDRGTDMGPEAAAENFAGWDYILLDPPCSGWGTVEKNPQVLALWQGDKIKPLAALQKRLLAEAFRLLKPGGALVYSTCTTNVQENEAQVLWALDNLKDAHGRAPRPIPLPPFPGLGFDGPRLGCAGVLRVSRESSLGQGFFIAALRKAGPTAPLCGPTALDAPAGLPADLIDQPLARPGLLPPGRLAALGPRLFFQPRAALDFLPPAFQWQGFPLGKVSDAGRPQKNQGRSAAPPAPASALWSRPRLDTSLRGLMPPPAEALARGAEVLDLQDLQPILKLISGQSLPYEPGNPAGQEAGLYFDGLPLCRLKLKGKRVMI